MRLISLDFDGPLHPTTAVRGWAHAVANLKAFRDERRLFRWVPHLSSALEKHPDVAILVHSGWRMVCPDSEIREFIAPLADRYVGSTGAGPRYRGIRDFIDRLNVEHWLVIDDAVDEFPPAMSELLLVDPLSGLSDVLIQRRLSAWLDRTKPMPQEAEGGVSARSRHEVQHV